MKTSTIMKLFCAICTCLSIAAGCATKTGTVSPDPEARLRKAFPDLPFDSIGHSDIQGLYEVISGLNLFYYYPEKEYLFFGDIVTTSGKSVTAEKKEGLAAKLMDKLPLDKAVITGNGKARVIEFTDPDCPYCKRSYDFLKTREDVTLYTFFAPFAHPAATAKVYFILSAQDRSKAYHDVFEGKSVVQPAEGYSEAVKKLAQEHMDLARSVGVSGTPTFFINGRQIVGADIQKLERLINEAGDEKKTEIKENAK